EKAALLRVLTRTNGSLDAPPRQSVPTLPSAVQGYTALRAAEVVVHPNGAFLFVSTRVDGLAGAALNGYLTVFRIDPVSGMVTYASSIEVGKEPRSFAVDPTGNFLVVGALKSASDNVVVYRIDSNTGALTQVAAATVSQPYFVGVIDLAQ